MQTYHYDVLVVGGGMVGLTFALALAKETPLSIGIIEANKLNDTWSASDYHPRVSALNLASYRILSALKVWPSMLAKRVSPFEQISIWDLGSNAKGDELSFTSQEVGESVLGYIVENNLLQHCLLEQIKTFQQIQLHEKCELLQVHRGEKNVTLKTATSCFEARMVVGADGARSWLRQHAHIAVDHQDYQQKGIVATVTTALPHALTARQVFCPTGPLAFLPLQASHQSSIVWTLPKTKAEEMLALDESSFKTALAQAFLYKLGEIETISQRFAFPLFKQQAKQYCKPRLALIGDAAHSVHPLAGLGVNIGLLDAVSLAEVLSEEHKAERDFSKDVVLRRYERWRKADNLPLLMGIDSIKHFFASQHPAVSQIRSLGLKLTNHFPMFKKYFILQAVGNASSLPKLARIASHPNI